MTCVWGRLEVHQNMAWYGPMMEEVKGSVPVPWIQGHGEKSNVYSRYDGQFHLLCALFVQGPPPAGSRLRINTRSHSLFWGAGSSLPTKRERRSPLLPAGPLNRPQTWVWAVRTQRKSARVWGKGNNPICCPEKRGSSLGQSVKSVYHPDFQRASGPHQNEKENSCGKSGVLALD